MTTDDCCPVKNMKRLRSLSDSSSSSSSLFSSLKEWIECHPQEGGFVHPSIRMDPHKRELYSIDPIAKGDVVFQIPSIIFPPRDKSAFSQESLWPGDIAQEKWYHAYADILLAWYLALKPNSIQPYINSLPDGMDQALPRCWSENNLKRLLYGSPVYQRAKEMKRGIQSDYEILVHHVSCRQQQQHTPSTQGDDCCINTNDNNGRLPSFEEFSNAMAAVTSRAFCCEPQNNETCMVPLLDLCNHHRGNTQKKNLSYRFEERTSKDGSLFRVAVVMAHSDIASGETLRITYGAQSNAQLLLNYGFCVDENVEPDGSSNDVLEFAPNILLRTGPRDYTYGPFIKALEYCRLVMMSTTIESQDDFDLDRNNHDLETLLDAADELENTEENIDDDNIVVEEEEEEKQREEIKALQFLRNRLLTMAESYVLKQEDTARLLQLQKDSQEYFAAVLIKSELRTIQFFCWVVDVILDRFWNSQNGSGPVKLVQLSTSNLSQMNLQVKDMLMAYKQVQCL